MITPDGPEALRPYSLGMRGPTHKAAERERGNFLIDLMGTIDDTVNELMNLEEKATDGQPK
ncbi:MAG: hypothetical protein JNM91_01040 [Flavobacteriales bacterium]|nr:hypothetical protein [Flavobacteriales bacterium]